MTDYLYTSLSIGYKVFITIPGVVTHKVPFNVDPSFYGEYDFLAHGLHYITASTPFLEWNKENQVCMYEIFSIKKLVIRPRAVGLKETGEGGDRRSDHPFPITRSRFCPPYYYSPCI